MMYSKPSWIMRKGWCAWNMLFNPFRHPHPRQPLHQLTLINNSLLSLIVVSSGWCAVKSVLPLRALGASSRRRLALFFFLWNEEKKKKKKEHANGDRRTIRKHFLFISLSLSLARLVNPKLVKLFSPSQELCCHFKMIVIQRRRKRGSVKNVRIGSLSLSLLLSQLEWLPKAYNNC